MASRNKAFPVALVSMPWPLFNRPSIQLGALKAYAEEASDFIAVTNLHPYLEVAARIGPRVYQAISQNVWACEALYAPLVFPEQEVAARGLARKTMRKNKPNAAFDFDGTVSLLRDQLRDWVGRIAWKDFKLVGFSVCFSQLFSSLAAARAVKDQAPDLPVVFGGSACAGEIGASLVKTFSAVDYVVPGEGEEPLLRLCAFLAGKSPFPDQRLVDPAPWAPGSLKRGGQLPDLGKLPAPDYGDYFAELRLWFRREPFIPELPVEFSRGCWWNKCAFCNLNLQWCGYRAKKAEQMAREVASLADRHACLDFCFTDNVLPLREAGLFFDNMAKQRHAYRFFAEIRANQRGKILARYARGGLVTAQAGIESLSTALLRKMRKGATAIENIALMKDCLARGVLLEGNLIIEFPGSSDAEVEETLANLDFVLPFSPLATASFFLGHGSPVDEAPGEFNIRAVVRHPHYRKLVPKEIFVSLAFLLKDYRGDRQRQRRRWAPVAAKVRAWQRFHRDRCEGAISRPPLSYRDGGSFLIIRQESREGAVLQHRLKGLSRQIYLACAGIGERAALNRRFPGVQQDRLLRFLDDLVEKRLMFVEGTRYLSLAVPGR